jgi:TetR/AcrR family transcriptional regulator, regulator of biofilm formation and stress response
VPGTGVRERASEHVRETIVVATVRLVAAEGVAAVTHRRIAAEAGVSLSSTTWHFATKADILQAALRWTAVKEVDRITRHLEGSADGPAAWADALADWLVSQVTEDRDDAIALYRLQIELLGTPGASDVHRAWGEGLRAVGERVALGAPEVDVRLVIAALDGLRLGALLADADPQQLRPAVHRQLQALFAPA